MTAFLRHTEALASNAEEAVFENLALLRLPQLDRGLGQGCQFTTALLRTLFSSPTACLDTLRSHLYQLQRRIAASDLRQLRSLEDLLVRVDSPSMSKYQALLGLIADLAWTAADNDDRLIICTERLETLFFLVDRLPDAIGLPATMVASLHAGLRVGQRQQIVDSFNDPRSPARLLVCADLVSTNMALHTLSHRLIHFDIPWSATIIRQRNARIAQPRQRQPSQIAYLTTSSRNPCISRKQALLQMMMAQQGQSNRLTTNTTLHDSIRETRLTAAAIENTTTSNCERPHSPRRDYDLPTPAEPARFATAMGALCPA